MTWPIVPVTPGDAGELLTLQRAAFVTEAQLYDNPHLPPLTETLDALRADLAAGPALKAIAPRVGPPSRTGHTAVVKTAISLPDTVFERAERLAGKLGLTRSRLYALALEQYLEQTDDQPGPVTEALNRVHADPQPADDFGAAAARRLIEHGDWEW